MHINELNAVTREQARIRTLLFTIPCKEGWVKREDVLKLLRNETVLPYEGKQSKNH